VTNLFQLAKKVTNLFQIANKSDEIIPNGSVEPVPIDKSCRLYSIWRTFELIPNGRVGLVQPPVKSAEKLENCEFSDTNMKVCLTWRLLATYLHS
jgi:hypothetical protein